MVCLSAPMLTRCSTTNDPVVSQTPIIPDLMVITLSQPGTGATVATAAGNNFVYSAESEVASMILFLCDNSTVNCAAAAVSNGQVNLSKVIAGNSTSKTMGMTTTAMSEVYNISGGAFTTKYSNSLGGAFQWFIIGYDSEGNLIAASPAFTVNVTSW